MSGALRTLAEILSVARPKGTAATLVAPSALSKEVAAKVVAEFDLAPVLRDLAAAAAREVANKLDGVALRPADYAIMAELPDLVSKRIVQQLADDPSTFAKMFADYLQLRG
jgi:hypothetical protein